MKLAIVVVYMVADEHAPLLDLHLERIERHTSVPYAIYGSVNRLQPKFRERLARDRHVSAIELPPTDLRGAPEHSVYLEQLVRAAIDDGASHIVTLHVDSFPIRDGWIEELSGRLSSSCVLATIEGINTACLLFSRDFYLNSQPAFLPIREQRATAEYRKYLERKDPNVHSGIGYGFAAHRDGRDWYSMRQTSRSQEVGAATYDDLLFHLKGAVRLEREPPRELSPMIRRVGQERFARILSAFRLVVPAPLRLLIRKPFFKPLARLIDSSKIQREATAMRSDVQRLFADSDAFLNDLRAQ
jgi:hypothetical protein